MALRKIIVAVDCADDNEKEIVQMAFQEISNMRVLNGAQIKKMVPLIKKNRNDLVELFNMITKDGIGSLLSIKGGRLIARLQANNK